MLFIKTQQFYQSSIMSSYFESTISVCSVASILYSLCLYPSKIELQKLYWLRFYERYCKINQLLVNVWVVHKLSISLSISGIQRSVFNQEINKTGGWRTKKVTAKIEH